MPKRPQDDLDTHRRMIFRRRQLFTAMVFAAVGSLALGLIPDLRWLLFVHLGIDVSLALFVWWLVRQKNIAPALEQVVPVEEPAEEMYLKAGEL